MSIEAVLTFDCYGTLIDWLSGARKAFLDIYIGRDDLVDKFIEYWGEKDWELVSSGIYMPYRDILREGFKYALEKIGLEYNEVVLDKLTYSIYDWRPFPDVKKPLDRLINMGVELGIISNTDKDFIMKSIEHIGVEFKYIIVAEDIKIYKPDPRVFKEARKRLPDKRWIHISAYPQYDIIPAVKAGVETILLDRYGYREDVEKYNVDIVYSLDELVEKLSK